MSEVKDVMLVRKMVECAAEMRGMSVTRFLTTNGMCDSALMQRKKTINYETLVRFTKMMNISPRWYFSMVAGIKPTGRLIYPTSQEVKDGLIEMMRCCAAKEHMSLHEYESKVGVRIDRHKHESVRLNSIRDVCEGCGIRPAFFFAWLERWIGE